MLHALKNLVYGKFALPELLLAGTVVCSAMPLANAMVASGGDTGTHHAATGYVAEIWNRTVYIGTENSGGTGTYLGQSADGRCWVLTAAHVSVGAMSVATTSTSSFSLTTTGDVVEITNSDGTVADLKLVAVNKNAEYTSFLEGQRYTNPIGIYSGSLTTTTPLYTVGTGRSSAIGSTISSEPRQKEWAGFTADEMLNAETKKGSTTWVTSCYVELFQSEKTGFQACTYDSGSGVFIYGGAETGRQVVGVNLAVAGYNGTEFVSSLGNIGYMENASENNILTCSTFFANLSLYAEQINAVMAIPEPSAFGCLAGTFALALAASSRRRRA